MLIEYFLLFLTFLKGLFRQVPDERNKSRRGDLYLQQNLGSDYV